MKIIAALFAAAIALSAGTTFADAGSRPFATHAAGTVSEALGCNGTCISATFTGTATSTHLGTGAWNATLTVPLASIVPAGNGEYCGPGTGSATLTAANGDLLTFDYSGTVCEQGTSLVGVPHTFTGTYTITGGTGRFAGATGSGTITAGDDGAGNASMDDTGTIAY